MKPILIVDWHDTLEDYTNPFLKFLETKGIDIKVDEIQESFIMHGVPDNYFTEFENKLDDLVMIEDARESIEKLSEKYRIICVSASKAIERYQYQLKFKYPYIEKFLYGKPKSVIIHEIGGSIFVDDQIPHLNGSPCRSIAFTQPWNRTWQGERGNWKEIIELIG